MTTNQKIDGVPRELLEWVLRVTGVVTFSTDPHVKELRALLDAPARPYCKVCVGSPSLPKGCPIDNGQHDPAAQPQGEPVAPFYISREDWNTLVRDDVAIALIRTSRRKGKIFTEPLYAEQPAPVAVREFVANTVPDDEIGDDWTKGYEECKRRVLALISTPASTK